MSILSVRLLAIASVILAGAACGNDRQVITPSPTPAPTVTVTGISPTVGSTSGDTTVTITGTGFQSGVAVTFDGVRTQGTFDGRDSARTTMFLQTPPHAVGTVDLLVSNPGGAALRLTGAYTYAVPASFDFSGHWDAFSFDGSDRVMDFTVQNNALVSVTCTNALNVVSTITPFPPPVVNNGAFSFVGNDGTAMTGRMVAASAAVGTINVAACANMDWRTYPRR